MFVLRHSELLKVEFVTGDAEVVDDVRDNTAWHVTGMPRKGDETVGSERIRIVTVTARRAEQFAADFPQAALQLPAVVGWVLAHGSGGEDEFVAESRWNRATGFQQRFQMDFCGLLKA